MKEPMCNYVIKVPGSSMYHFRRKIPLDLVPHYSKREIKKSLRTSNRREAEKLSRIEASKLDAEWDVLRHASFNPPNVSKIVPVLESDVANYVSSYRDGRFLQDLDAEVAKERIGLRGPDPHNIEAYGLWHLAAFRAERRLAAQRGHSEQFRKRIEVLLSEQERRLELGLYELPDRDYQHFHVTEAMRNACKALLYGDGPLAWMSTSAASQPMPSPKEGRGKSMNSISLFELVDRWAAERSRNQKTVNMYNLTASRFKEHVGSVIVQAIKRADVVRFKDGLLKVGQSPANTNKQLTVISTLLNHAIANALIEENPATGIRVQIDKRRKPRVAFSAEALNAIFSSQIYTIGLRPRGGGGEAAYWLPLLALYTGARIEELGQLHPSDVLQEDYYLDDGSVSSTWVIRFRHHEEFGQTLKNFGSNRRVPVHAELVRLGFISYAKAAMGEGRMRLFPLLIPDKYGTETAQFSKWVNRYFRTECLVADTRMTFHSFRHTFKDFCRVAAGGSIADELTGHSSGRVGDAYGADFYPLHPLVEAMKKYKTLGLDLSKLKSPA